MKYRQQYDSSDCGAACLAMIASYYGANLNIAEVRHFAGTDSEGTNFHGMLQAANHYGLKARAVEGENKSINKNLPTPFIAHIKTEKIMKMEIIMLSYEKFLIIKFLFLILTKEKK